MISEPEWTKHLLLLLALILAGWSGQPSYREARSDFHRFITNGADRVSDDAETCHDEEGKKDPQRRDEARFTRAAL